MEGVMIAVQPCAGLIASLVRANPADLNGEHVSANLQRSRGKLVAGERYRVTFERIPSLPAVDLL